MKLFYFFRLYYENTCIWRENYSPWPPNDDFISSLGRVREKKWNEVTHASKSFNGFSLLGFLEFFSPSSTVWIDLFRLFFTLLLLPPLIEAKWSTINQRTNECCPRKAYLHSKSPLEVYNELLFTKDYPHYLTNLLNTAIWNLDEKSRKKVSKS